MMKMGAGMKMGGLLGLGLWLGACGGGELDSWGCRSDADCKHDRVCKDGLCQDPAGVCQTDADCPAGLNCRDARCTLCDADADGAFGPTCNGGDCDDSDPAVYPGANELCGDDLDNDCDGLTDPASLCSEKCQDVQCSAGFACDPQTGHCVPICEPKCAGKQCGPDGCGASCGTCPSGQQCDRDGRCAAACEDRCNPGSLACVGNGVVRCTDTDGDGCVEWSQPQACPTGQSCLDGRCTGCTPSCAGRECGDNGCGGSCGTCPGDLFCDSGKCVGECYDECWWGESQCISDWETIECGQWDQDDCLEFGPPMPCPEGFCDWDTGQCGGGCRDECAWGESFCASDHEVVQCGEYDGDPCTEFSPPTRCPNGRCDRNTGRCRGACTDECAWGERYCIQDWAWVECGEWDGDPCLEFSPPMECPADSSCDWLTGVCVDQNGRPGAGQPCGLWNACPADWAAAWTCVEFSGSTDGICSYPCQSDDECALDFPSGCCRELAPGYSVCLPDPDLCQVPGAGYLQWCAASSGQTCLPNMFCNEDSPGQDSLCLFTCDRAMGVCPLGGSCLPIADGTSTGVCLPTGNGQFGDVCTLADGCVSGLLCTPLDDAHPGYCNTMCNDFLPCPNGFDCALQDNSGGLWCTELCASQTDCDRLGNWECVWSWGPDTGVCLPRS